MNQRIIYLNGFMAAGKSTIGPILANTLGWDFYDLDKVIEMELGEKIVDIFKTRGEQYFRDKETETLIRLSKMCNVVISLGGGTSSNNNNLEIISRTGKVVYLKASPEALFNRLKNKKDRPLFNTGDVEKSKEELKNRIVQLLRQRTPYYEQADLIIDTDNYPLGLTVDKIARLILKKIDEEN
ncbi:MAG: shikimate kinase [Bacteroidota bacterium]|nr:shikimate kinase [Bacteroidota bacterium]MDP4191312.1 shikimate kinase [Bacteroidota bacterium]MDP4195169.1 shikimate kinase [Bacteroidota bacterium]